MVVTLQRLESSEVGEVARWEMRDSGKVGKVGEW